MSKIYHLGIAFLWIVFFLQNVSTASGETISIDKNLQNDFSIEANSLISETTSPSQNTEMPPLPANPQCDSDVPHFVVDLTGKPDSVWLSPSVERKGNCCGTSHPDRCVSFTVILDENAVGLEFDIAVGAIPPGSLFYQIDCGAPNPVGSGVCLPGGQAYEVTFCKPGANDNVYRIRSTPGLIIPDSLSTRIICDGNLEISGVAESTVTWNDITGSGIYNSYLSCTSGCLSTTFTPDEFSPATILYEVCGDVIDETCGAIYTVCDTVVVNVYPEVIVSIDESLLTFCEDNPPTLVATATPVSPTYTYEWYNNYDATGSVVSSTNTYVPTVSGSYSVVAVDYASPLDCSSDTLNFDVTVLNCLPQCATATICPDETIEFTTVSDFVAAGGQTNFPCPINNANIQLISSVSDGGYCPEIITQTYELWDDCGNRGNCDAVITRTDTQAPVLSGIPGDITLLCSTVPDPPTIYTDITATDNCDASVEITISEISTQTFDNSITSVIYQVIRTWTATDDCGNSTNVSQTINAICEYCFNGIDDDGDGAIDESDPDCPCSFPNYKLTCDDKQYYYVPPVWQMNPNGGSYGPDRYTDPSSLVISTPYGSANVTIRTADGASFNQSITVNQGTAEVVPLNYNLIQTPNFNAIENDKGLIIESDQLIQVIYRISSDNNKMLMTIKGEQALGQRFRAGSQTNVCGLPDTGKRENHFISIMAVENNTTVNFEFTADMKGLGNTHSITLNAGETYLMIDNDKNETVTGTLITASKPIAVVSGSQHSRQCSDTGRDAGADQLIPTCGIGTDYVIFRGQDDDSPSPANYAVVVAVTSNTEVFINGNSSPVATLNPGEFYTYDMPGPNFSRHYIQTSNPAYLYQFGSVQDNGEIGMAIAAPIDGCRGDRFVEFFEFPNSTVNNVTTLIPNTGLSSLTLNGNPYTDYSSAESIPGLPGWSAIIFDDASLQPYNIIESDELFNASQFVGNATGGTFGYLTSFKDKIIVYDPVSGLPTYNYFADTICSDSPYSHCITSSSCSGNQFITSIIGSSHTQSYSIVPNSSCFEYIPQIGYNGMDTITVLLSDDFGFTQAVCISFYICGTLPLIDGVTDSTATCSISEVPVYADFNEFLADGGSASDDCSGLNTSSFTLASEVSDGNSCPETITRTYEVANDCGLISSFTQTIIIDNDIIPTISGIPNDTTVSCESIPAPPTIGVDIIGESFCGIPPTVTFSETRTDGACENSYLLTRTWTVVDECGNTFSASQDINVFDNTPPTASNPLPIQVQCVSDVPGPDVDVVIDEADNCFANPIVAFIGDVSDGNTCPETITRIYSVTDDCGNQITVEQLITILDDISPSLSCPPDITVSSSSLVPTVAASYNGFTLQGGIASDNCELDTISFTLVSEVTNTVSGNDEITRTYQIADLCGNANTCDQIITIDESTTNTDPNDINVDCIDDVPAPISSYQELINNGGSASSTCGIDTTSLILTNEVSDGNSCPEVITRSYEMADSCGNTLNFSHQVTVDDNIDPLINCLPDTTVTADSLVPPAVITFDEFILQSGTSSDNCELDSTSFVLINETTNIVGGDEVITRTYQIADQCGNTNTCEQKITVDKPGTNSTDPNNINVNCIDDIPAPISSYQELTNLGGSASSTCGVDTTSLILANEVSDGNSCPEVITRSYEMTDSCGNTLSFSHQVIVDDNIDPLINCLPDTTVTADSLVPPAVITFDEFILQGGTASDNCELDSTSFILLNEVSNTVGGNVVITRTYQIADVCGNTNTCEQEITVDNPNTSITNPPDDLVECIDDIPSEFISLPELIADGGNISSTCEIDQSTFSFVSEVSDGNKCPETVTRLYEIADSCGNLLTINHRIIIDDITAPDITCPPDVDVVSVGDIPTAFTDLSGFTSAGGVATDNCGIEESSFNLFQEESVLDSCPMYISRIYEIADSCGNVSQCEQRINIIDNQPPVFTAPDDISLECITTWPDAYQNLAEFIAAGGVATDNYELLDSTFVLLDEDTLTTNNSIHIQRTYSIKDLCDNESKVVHTIISSDDVPPNANCNFITISLNIDGQYELTSADIDSIASGSNDNCTPVNELIYTVDQQTFDCTNVGEIITFTLTVTDLNGNSSICEASVMVNDVYVPEIACKDTTLYLDENGYVLITDPVDLLSSLNDNCGIDSIFIDKNEFNCEDVGDNAVEVTVRDINNLIASCTSNVTVLDTIAPAVITQNITVFLNDSEQTTITPDMIDNGSYDACGIEQMLLDKHDFTCVDIGDNLVTLTAIDFNGNTGTETATVTVIALNEKPIAENDEIETIQDTPISFNPLQNDSDPDGSIDINSFVVLVEPLHGTLSAGLNDFIYTPDGSYIGDDEFSYIICDDGVPCVSRCDTAQILVHVLQPNIPPVANNDEFSKGCYTLTGILTINDSDPDGHALLVNTTPVTQPTHGSVTLSADGSFVYQFEQNTTAIDSFIYKVCDDTYDSKCSQATVYITIFKDNDCDGIDDEIDIDDDDDGILDVVEGDGAIDSDGDGIPDSLDIDADNDGIVDNIETQAEGHFIAPSGIDENHNGLDDVYEDNNTLGVFPADTDNDGTPDYLDLDTDDDGIPDLIEGFDIGAKGIAEKTPSNIDTDMDGYDDVFDSHDGRFDTSNLDNPFGSTARLQDFDNDGWRDWRDVDDDGDGIKTKYEDLDNNGLYNDDIDADGHPEYLDKRDECELYIPEGFSPNNDGVHDFFQIYCIEKYPNAKLLIFDRWGNKLYEHEHYGNQDFWGSYEESWWDGTLTKNPSRKVRPETHLYILETTPGDSERGFVMVSY